MRDNLVDYSHIFLNDVPLLDVRAPVEFAQGTFPGAVNVPLMDDGERHQVGTCYEQLGQQAAVALGHQLVSGRIKQLRIAQWAAFAHEHPDDGVLYCFRGGLRSQIAQQWLQSEAGIAYPRVIGGYKAMRGFLLDTTQAAAAECSFFVLSGLTGTGKTEVIAQLANGLDLEGHANHRGSSFGGRVTGQPAQIDFENRLAIDILKKRAAGHNILVVEDEGRHVGKCSVPLPLRQRLEQVPIVCLMEDFERRVERIQHDYVAQQCAAFVTAHGPDVGMDLFAARLLESLDKLAKRLGGSLHQSLREVMQRALTLQKGSGDVALHRDWITVLMRQYYDPMYAYQRSSRVDRIRFEGDHAAVLAYLRDQSAGV